MTGTGDAIGGAVQPALLTLGLWTLLTLVILWRYRVFGALALHRRILLRSMAMVFSSFLFIVLVRWRVLWPVLHWLPWMCGTIAVVLVVSSRRARMFVRDMF